MRFLSFTFISAIIFSSLAFGLAKNWREAVETSERLIYDNPAEAIRVSRQILREIDPKSQPDLWLELATNLASSLILNEQMNDAKDLLVALTPMAQQSTNVRWRVMNLLHQASINAFQQQTSEARDQVGEAIKLAEAQDEKLLEARARSQLAIYYSRKNQDRDALENIAIANRLLRGQTMNNDVIAILNNLSICFIVMGESNLAHGVDVLQQLKRHAMEHNLRFLGHLAAYNLGDTYYLLKQNDESIVNYQDAARFARAIHDQLSLAYSELGLGGVLYKKKKYVEARIALKNALNIFAPSGNKLKTYEALMSLVQIALAEGKADLALQDIEAIEKLQFDAELIEVIADFHSIKADVLKALGQYSEALKELEVYISLKHDANLQREKESAGKFAAQFELERKEQANTLLKQQNRIQELELQRSEGEGNIKTLMLVGVFLIFVIMSFDFIRVHRRNREINRLHQYIQTNILQRFLPPAMIEEILAGRSRLDETPHNQTVTVLFADICEFTQITDRLDAETVASILNDFFVSMTDVIFSEQGTIDKFIGDAIMVLFGAPTAMSPDEQAKRALICAQKMMTTMEELNARWHQLLGRPIAIRIGIHQGPAVVGSFGGQKRSDYTVVGRAVNIASRVESLATPGHVFFTEAVAAHLADHEQEALGPHFLRGLQEPIAIYRLRLDAAQEDKRAS